jgi:hypothetical protein
MIEAELEEKNHSNELIQKDFNEIDKQIFFSDKFKPPIYNCVIIHSNSLFYFILLNMLFVDEVFFFILFVY